jgi:hypothetical protein
MGTVLVTGRCATPGVARTDTVIPLVCSYWLGMPCGLHIAVKLCDLLAIISASTKTYVWLDSNQMAINRRGLSVQVLAISV